MTKKELKRRIEDNHNHFKEVAENYVNESWGSYLDLNYVDLVLAGIGVGKIIALEEENRIAELEAQIEKMKCCGNCKYQEIEDYTGCPICNVSDCNFNSKWEIKEK